MRRLTIFAKGNLDLRDSLHSCTIGGKVRWNGINEILRARRPGILVRVRHETFDRSDALLRADGHIPPAVAQRQLPLGPYSISSQFSRAVFDTPCDAFVFSLQPDVTSGIFRHRRDGYLLYAFGHEAWQPQDQRWLWEEFEHQGLLDPAASMRNFKQIIARLRERSDAPILIYNVSSVVAGESVHCYEGIEEPLSTRIRRFNLGLIELSQETEISIIDVDGIVAKAGADRVKIDPIHLTPEGYRLVAEEVVGVLEALGLLAHAEGKSCA